MDRSPKSGPSFGWNTPPAVHAVDVSALRPVAAPPRWSTAMLVLAWKPAGRPSDWQLARRGDPAGSASQLLHGSLVPAWKPLVEPRNCSNSAGARYEVP